MNRLGGYDRAHNSKQMNKPLKILLLEDVPEDVHLIERTLRKVDMAFTSFVVKGKEEFEKALEEFEPEVVLADHSLPQFNSIEAFDLFGRFQAARGISVPFILVTGNVSEEFAIQMLKAGVDDYILKTALKRLPSAIESALEKCKVKNDRLRYHNRIVRMEALMRQAEALAHFGSWETDLASGKQTWSDETYRIYGFEPGEVEPTFDLYLSLLHPEDAARMERLRAEGIEKLEKDGYQFRIIDRRGTLKHLYCKFTIKRNSEGRAVQLTGFNVDITQRVLAGQSLRINEQVYRSLFDENPDAVFSLDAGGRFTNVNGAFARMVGFTIDDLRGTDFRRILPKTQFERVYTYMLSALERKPQRYRSNFVNSEGKKLALDVSVMPIVVDEKIVGVHCIAKDVTQSRVPRLSSRQAVLRRQRAEG